MDSDFVFVNLWQGVIGRPLSYKAVEKLIQRARRRVGFRFTAHQFRHTLESRRWRSVMGWRLR